MTSLRSLSLAHIRVPEVATESLKKIIKKNPLKHLDLSGCLKSAEQVKAVVKKISNHISLLAVHLSQTPVIHKDTNCRDYIRKKLRLVDPPEFPA